MKTKPGRRSYTPRVWVVDAYRAGEQKQLRALAASLGWPYLVVSLKYRKWEIKTNLFRGRDLRGVDRARSSPLSPPWPDLVLSAGMRNEPVCRWIKEQSGGHSKIVFIGRLWADPAHFDLVVTTPQYRVPARSNVLKNDLPLHRVNRQALALAAEQWAPRLQYLPRPYIAVNIGGNSGPYAFGRRAAQRLMRDAGALAEARGGSLLVTSSARTPAAVLDIVARQDRVPMHFYRWRPKDPDNPYQGFLALADELIVTADSIAMLSEACATGRPLHMFDLGMGPFSMRWDMYYGRQNQAALAQTSNHSAQSCDQSDLQLSTLLYRGLMRWGWKHLTRDISQVHRRLIESGRAQWLSPEFSLSPVGADAAEPAAGQEQQSPDMRRALERIAALLERSGIVTV